MLGILQTQAAGWASWQIRESDAEGDYIRGTNLAGAKIRITGSGGDYEVEIWFDSDHDSKTNPEQRQAIVRIVDQLVTGNLGAKDLADA